jgi:hypothetical protein
MMTEPLNIKFPWDIQDDSAIHARHIITDTGWTILMDRGLDIFQYFDSKQIRTLNIAKGGFQFAMARF